jgi:hypothetical protein
MPPHRWFAFGACLGLVLLDATAADRTSTSDALRAANPDHLSGGVFMALDASGVYRASATTHAVRAGIPDVSKGRPPVILDARVGVNIRLGDDPPAIPVNQSGQAEPHLYRSAANPDVLLATFQEGRLTDAGSLDCGYAVSLDGGLTWRRALIPQLTPPSGGTYNRATDPVAAIGPQGELYLNTLGSISGAFSTAAVLVSRSSDAGGTWSAPAVVYQSLSTQVSPDKNWLAVNDYPATATAGRLVATWTSFTSNASGQSTGSNLMAAVSDDRGATWSTPVAITPVGAVNQGTQPVFLPDGSLVVVYVTFLNGDATTQFSIQCKRSTDGGRSFPAASTTAVASVAGWDDPDLRDGIFLPSATAARQAGDLFITYTAVVAGTPRVLVTKSTDKGATWSVPVIVSDNPAGASVVNPAVAVTPDGQTVSVVFMDKRNAADAHNAIDIYAAQSFDGGTSWQPNVRLTTMTSDIRNGPPTTRGYMFGDYMAVAPSLAADQPFVGIWCDARTGDSDPFTVRFAGMPSASFAAWEVARFPRAELADASIAGPLRDPDNDGLCNLAEYFHETEPRVADSSSGFDVEPGGSSVTIAYPYRLAVDSPLNVRWEHSSDGVTWTTAPHASAPDDFPLPQGNTAVDTFSHVAGTPEFFRETFSSDASFATTASSEAIPVNTDARLINVSTRGNAGTGTSQMIVGFVIDGTKTMLVRGAGPSLTAFGVTAPLADPQLTLTSPTQSISGAVANAAWQQSTVSAPLFDRLGAFPFSAGSHDTALVQTLPTGNYSAVVSSASGATGPVLVEAYDADADPGATGGPRIVDLSSRAKIGGTDGGTLIAGFVISGTQPRRILIRSAGPSLAVFGLTDLMTDPQLTVYRIENGTSMPIATNDDWPTTPAGIALDATAHRLGAFPLNPASLDAALLLTLPPGLYSASVTGVNGAAGIALVEVYDAD